MQQLMDNYALFGLLAASALFAIYFLGSGLKALANPAPAQWTLGGITIPRSCSTCTNGTVTAGEQLQVTLNHCRAMLHDETNDPGDMFEQKWGWTDDLPDLEAVTIAEKCPRWVPRVINGGRK